MTGTLVVPEEELTAISAAARRVARARGADASTADDIAQETITRLLAASARLEPEARLPFALTTAGNLLVSLHRAADRDRRHRHRLADYQAPNDPQLTALALDEAAAVRAALAALTPDDRRLLVQHVEGESTADLATLEGSNAAAIAARLARTRAKLRLDYLLALRRVELPSSACRRVLLAVSAADQRRQTALGAAAHLQQCSICTDLIPPLARRSSSPRPQNCLYRPPPRQRPRPVPQHPHGLPRGSRFSRCPKPAG
jgi:RNA polymerase sigma factor (sigma-70 family)